MGCLQEKGSRLCWDRGVWWGHKKEMAGPGKNQFLLQTMRWTATVVVGVVLFPGADFGVVAGFQLGAVCRSA